VNSVHYKKRASTLFGQKNKKATSNKLQAASLTVCPRDDRISYERNIMETKQLKRIADALEEILRLVREDMKEMKKAAK
jgi:hypothetical protein